jgi:hypothetical protein
MFPTKTLLVLTCICATFASSLFAHPFHTSVAEVDWNRETGRWEISLRVHAGDMELALTKQHGRKINIESAEAEKLVQAYLATRFQFLSQAEAEKLKAAAGSVIALKPEAETKEPAKANEQFHWLGQEFEGNWMWLYFELTPPESKEQTVLFSQLLTEINDDQINIVSVRQSGKRVTRQTNRNQMWIEIQ